MIAPEDYPARGWQVASAFAGDGQLSQAILEEMTSHPEAPGESARGIRNVLHAFILSMRPKIVLEVGSHIGLGSVVIGSALKANGFGRSFHLEPQDHYYALLSSFIQKAGLSGVSFPLQRFSTDPGLATILGEKADIIFLDANHSYSHVMTDLRIADDLLADNGLMFLDDVGPKHSGDICSENRGGVRQALLDFTENNPSYSVIFLEPPFWLNPCGLAIACKQNRRTLGRS